MNQRSLQDSLVPGVTAGIITAIGFALLLFIMPVLVSIGGIGLFLSVIIFGIMIVIPLPLLYVGLGYSTWATAIGAILALIASLLIMPVAAAFQFFIWLGISAFFIVQRTHHDIQQNGRPDIQKLLFLCFILNVIYWTVWLVVSYDHAIQTEQMVHANMLSSWQAITADTPQAGSLTKEQFSEFMSFASRLIWPVNAVIQYASLVISVLLAINILSRREIWPPFKFSMVLFHVPFSMLLIGIIAIGFATSEGQFQRPAFVILAIIIILSAICGFHMIHLLLRGTPWKTPALIFLYGFTVISGFMTIPFMAIVGILDAIFSLRPRIIGALHANQTPNSNSGAND